MPQLVGDDPLELVASEIRNRGYGGDIRPVKIVYLAATSRVLAMRAGAMPVHLLLLGSASSGKTYTVTFKVAQAAGGSTPTMKTTRPEATGGKAVSAPVPEEKREDVKQALAKAGANRKEWKARGLFAINLVSSPGSGKTTLLVETIGRLAGRHPLAVIEGDQQTSNDAERIRATGAQAIQVNTGKGCHLDAHMVGHALEKLPLADNAVLMIENVGNLVCPAAFDLGEAGKVVILSVTEGEDKPLKYPDMFRAARLMLVNKCDLLPYLQFDVDKAIAYAKRVNPLIEVIRVSATTGEGMADWLAWLERSRG